MLNPFFEGQKHLFKGIFLKILALCRISTQEQVMMAYIQYTKLQASLVYHILLNSSRTNSNVLMLVYFMSLYPGRPCSVVALSQL